MAGGLVGLLDDVAALAKLAAASVDDVGMAAGRASMKAAGVVVDDAAVTPAYVRGLAADRELPIIKKIALGSLRNKLLFILPVALLLSAVAPTRRRDHLDVRRLLPRLRRRAQGHPRRAPRRPRPRRAGGRPGGRRRGQDRVRGHPHRLHPVGRDHGDLAQGGHRRAPRDPGRDPGARGRADHGGRLRRGGAHREDGRHRAEARRAPVGRDRSARATCSWSACRRCWRGCR